MSEETACIEAWDRHVLVRQRGPFHRFCGGTESALAPKEASARQEFVQMQILHRDAVSKGHLQRLEGGLSTCYVRGVPQRFVCAQLQPSSLRDLRPGSVGERKLKGVREHLESERADCIRGNMG